MVRPGHKGPHALVADLCVPPVPEVDMGCSLKEYRHALGTAAYAISWALPFS